ncbi:MAG: arginine--tRNA ligase [Candidatus Shapirobacteria bacterium]|jgi:arginyl-tRNA synthetase
MDKIKEYIKKALSELGYEIFEDQIIVERPGEEKFGDYSTSVAMILAKRERINPVELANKLKHKLDEITDKTELIEKIEVAGAFVNFYLKNEYLIKKAEELNYEIEFLKRMSNYGKGKTVVIDYSAPNIAKPFGIGHLRSTDIGQAILNIYKLLGWKTMGDNHLGDWGTQFGKLIVAIKKWGDKPVDKMSIGDLERLYVKFHKESENSPELIEEGREWFAKLEDKDEEARKIWQQCVDLSIKEFNRVYEMLGVKIDFAHGESFYEDMLPTIVKELEEKKVAIESQGALIVEFGDMPPAMVQKTNKTTTYLTRDLATIKYRLENWKPDLIIYEVGADQTLHFKQLFSIAKMMNWVPKTGLVHIAHGLIRWPSGKFSTRKGDTIHLEEVIDRAMKEAERLATGSTVAKDLSPEEKTNMIKAVAIGAIKFNDLAADPKRDIIFDWERVMNLEGNSGPYLQYTYARCLSVLNKTRVREQKNILSVPEIVQAEEVSLLKLLAGWEERILESAERFMPSIIADQLIKTARAFNEFYAKYRIVDNKDEDWRVFLTKSTASGLKLGLKLLGIETVDRM